MIVSIFTKNVASNKVSLAMLYPTFPLSPSGRVLRQKKGGGGEILTFISDSVLLCL